GRISITHHPNIHTTNHYRPVASLIEANERGATLRSTLWARQPGKIKPGNDQRFLVSKSEMGCCGSRPAGPNSPYPGDAASASARAINTVAARPAAGSPLSGDAEAAASPTSTRSPQRHRHRQPLDQHINKPLRWHRWASRSRVWTREDLAAERKDFFDTRVTGRVEVWQAIKTALEVLWESDPNPPPGTTAPTQEQQEEALLTAQSIMMAADITLPTGNLAQGVYDRLGNYYALPEHVVCNPVNVINASDLPPSDDGDEIDDDEADIGSIGDTKQPYIASSAEDDETDKAAQRRKEKGKEVEVEEETITVRCRLSENARDVVVTLPKKSPVRVLARRIVEEAKLPNDTSVRIAYLGKILRDTTPLTLQGWQEGHVLNAMCFSKSR
ncbi:hypothetical protein PpBr36_07325, partial [Pyricularia pennisetigena]|uniref:hypothetical protein n=1 Tax=Pyricularia pennisetigena TaxID=1578925 RepID=UPI0011538793